MVPQKQALCAMGALKGYFQMQRRTAGHPATGAQPSTEAA